jgi:hypothetical protein
MPATVEDAVRSVASPRHPSRTAPLRGNAS